MVILDKIENRNVRSMQHQNNNVNIQMKIRNEKFEKKRQETDKTDNGHQCQADKV